MNPEQQSTSKAEANNCMNPAQVLIPTPTLAQVQQGPIPSVPIYPNPPMQLASCPTANKVHNLETRTAQIRNHIEPIEAFLQSATNRTMVPVTKVEQMTSTKASSSIPIVAPSAIEKRRVERRMMIKTLQEEIKVTRTDNVRMEQYLQEMRNKVRELRKAVRDHPNNPRNRGQL